MTDIIKAAIAADLAAKDAVNKAQDALRDAQYDALRAASLVKLIAAIQSDDYSHYTVSSTGQAATVSIYQKDGDSMSGVRCTNMAFYDTALPILQAAGRA